MGTHVNDDLVLICSTVAEVPKPPMLSAGSKCSSCQTPIWVSWGALPLKAKAVCLDCAGTKIASGDAETLLKLNPALGNDIEALKRQIVEWTNRYNGQNLHSVMQQRRLTDDHLYEVARHAADTGDLVCAQIVLATQGLTMAERHEVCDMIERSS